MTDDRPRRPLLTSAVEKIAPDSFAYSENRLELAHLTAEAVVTAGRGEHNEVDLVRLAEQVGLETLAELWRDATPSSLPGSLWMLYVLHTWCVRDGDEVAHLYRAGRALAPVDEVVAGAPDSAGPAEIEALADQVLTGLYEGDFGVALERAAAFFRIVAAGRDYLAADDESGDAQREKADRNRACSLALTHAARAWRAGTLH